MLAPSANVAVNGISAPHIAATALIPCSHRPLLILSVAPDTTGLMVNCDPPDVPMVDAGLPSHFSMVPAMPPQMDRIATFVSWKSSALQRV